MAKRKTKTVETKEIDLSAIFEEACGPVCASRCVEIMRQFPAGAHTGQIIANLESGTPDIRSLLFHLAETYKPKKYLEIGVRLGYSMAMVATVSPETSIVGVDMWITNYGGDPQTGPEGVEDQIKKLGHTGSLRFLNGNSHTILPEYFANHPKEFFDLILVDGDHVYEGAMQDLRDTLSHLAPGGFLVFDDLNEARLMRAWEDIQKEAPQFEYYAQGIVGLIYNKGK
jgi:predicted O-methyltransferase YrrM